MRTKALAQGLLQAGLKYAEPSGPALLARLKHEFEQNRLCLVLGAGVSRDCGLPSWPELTERLARRVVGAHKEIPDDVVRYLTGANALAQARILKCLYPVPDEFPKIVRDSLYETADWTRENPVLSAVVDLVAVASKADRVLDVITYNFDDLIERRCAKASTSIGVVYDEDTFLHARKSRTVYHVHGFLPQVDSELMLPLIFSEDEFNERMSDGQHWGNYIQQLLLRRHTCLFIGFSLTDPNLRRLLDVSCPDAGEPRHIILWKRYKKGDWFESRQIESDEHAEALGLISRHVLRDEGLQPLYVGEFSEIPALLKSLG